MRLKAIPLWRLKSTWYIGGTCVMPLWIWQNSIDGTSQNIFCRWLLTKRSNIWRCAYPIFVFLRTSCHKTVLVEASLNRKVTGSVVIVKQLFQSSAALGYFIDCEFLPSVIHKYEYCQQGLKYNIQTFKLFCTVKSKHQWKQKKQVLCSRLCLQIAHSWFCMWYRLIPLPQPPYSLIRIHSHLKKKKIQQLILLCLNHCAIKP